MIIKKLAWTTLFSIAMGYMEAVVVVYLRKIYYPDGFSFPLVSLDHSIFITETGREAATIIMLLSIGILTEKKISGKFAVFLYCFAIWDIFYYVFLKLLLNWPDSFLTPDILFLIPFPWIGPVLAPVIVSLTMIVLALTIIYFNEKNNSVTIRLREWFYFISGSVIVILTFMWDFLLHYWFGTKPGMQSINDANELNQSRLSIFVPHDFNWLLFFAGELIIIFGIIFLIKRLISEPSIPENDRIH